MKTTNQLITTIILCCSFFMTNAQGKVVYFPYFELINMEKDAGLQYSTSKLIKSYIENNHDFTVIMPERLFDSYVERESNEAALANALGKNAGYVLRGEIHDLEGTYIVSLGLYRSRNNEQVWHDMVKGSSEQDLDALLSRLGRSFMTNKTAKTDIEIDEVTEYDQKGVELAQIKVNHFVGAMLGGKHLFDESTLSGFGLAYTYDASVVLFNLNFEFYPNARLLDTYQYRTVKLQHGNVNLGIIYPFTRKRSTFYIDGGLEYGLFRMKEHFSDNTSISATETGIGLYAGGGYLINRNSTVNLRLFAAVSVPMYSVQENEFPGIKFGIITSFAK